MATPAAASRIGRHRVHRLPQPRIIRAETPSVSGLEICLDRDEIGSVGAKASALELHQGRVPEIIEGPAAFGRGAVGTQAWPARQREEGIRRPSIGWIGGREQNVGG
jgi:hypothetical protein